MAQLLYMNNDNLSDESKRPTTTTSCNYVHAVPILVYIDSCWYSGLFNEHRCTHDLELLTVINWYFTYLQGIIKSFLIDNLIGEVEEERVTCVGKPFICYKNI